MYNANEKRNIFITSFSIYEMKVKTVIVNNSTNINNNPTFGNSILYIK